MSSGGEGPRAIGWAAEPGNQAIDGDVFAGPFPVQSVRAQHNWLAEFGGAVQQLSVLAMRIGYFDPFRIEAFGTAFVAVSLGSGYDGRMRMVVSSDGRSLVSQEPLDSLGYAPGDLVEVAVLPPNGRAHRLAARQHEGKLIDDPITGLPVIDFGPDAPILTHDRVRELLVDFP